MKLYRHGSNTLQMWFPFEMAVPMAQELVWECGQEEVKWVLHGTPAAGNMVLGTLEMNCNAVVFCEDDHHSVNMSKCLVEKAAERLASGQSRVFGNPFLMAKFTPRGKAGDGQGDGQGDDKGEGDTPQKEHTLTGEKKKKKEKRKKEKQKKEKQKEKQKKEKQKKEKRNDKKDASDAKNAQNDKTGQDMKDPSSESSETSNESASSASSSA